MKAIQIKYLGPTNTKGSRLKAWTGAGTMIEGLDYSLNLYDQAEQLAQRYATKQGWQSLISGFGMLPNGDYVATQGGGLFDD